MENMPPPPPADRAAGPILPRPLAALARVVIVAALPLLFILINARLLMSNAYLQWEYNRPGFPADRFGMTTAERLEYAPLALAYLFNNEGIQFLADQTFPDGTPLYNSRELSHMVDVKNVTRDLTAFGLGLLALVAIGVLILALDPASRRPLLQALFAGSVLTIALILAGLLAVATSFSWLFTRFHALFFEGDSWLFLYSDTLIRLFPEQFWIDAFALMFGGALLEAALLGGIMWLLLRRRPPQHG